MVLKNQAPEAKMIQSKFPLDNFCMSFSVCVCVYKKQLNKNFIEYTIILPCKHHRITAFFWRGWVEKYMVTCNYRLPKFDFMAKKKKKTSTFLWSVYEQQNSSLS